MRSAYYEGIILLHLLPPIYLQTALLNVARLWRKLRNFRDIHDRLSGIDQGAIVDNKRLRRTLEFIRLVKSNRDDTRPQSVRLSRQHP